MNRSGGVAAALLAEFGLDPGTCWSWSTISICRWARCVCARSGGPGTHNGLRDICEAVGTGFPAAPGRDSRDESITGDLADYVLGHFDGDEVGGPKPRFDRAADAVESVLRLGVEQTMNTFNRRRTVRSAGSDRGRYRAGDLQIAWRLSCQSIRHRCCRGNRARPKFKIQNSKLRILIPGS